MTTLVEEAGKAKALALSTRQREKKASLSLWASGQPKKGEV